MAFDLGSIRATLGLDESNFVRGMVSAESASEIFGDSIVRFVNNPLLGTIGIFKQFSGAIASAVRDTAEYNQEIVSWSERLGVASRTISGLLPQVQRLGGEVDDLGDLFIQASEKALQAAQGEGAKDFFDRLSVSVVDASGNLKSAETIVRDVADGLSGLRNDTERMAVATELFSTAGEKLLPILKQGSRGIDEMIDRSERYGLTIDERGAQATREFTGTVADLTDAMTGIRRSGAQSFIEGFSGALDESGVKVDKLSNRIRTRLNTAMGELGNLVGQIADSQWLDDTLEGFTALLETVQKTNTEVDKLQKKMDAKVGEDRNIYEQISFWDAPISYTAYHLFKFGYLGFSGDPGKGSLSRTDIQRLLEEQERQREREQSRALGG